MELDDLPEAKALSKRLHGKIGKDGHLEPAKLADSPSLVLIMGGGFMEFGVSAWWKVNSSKVRFENSAA